MGGATMKANPGGAITGEAILGREKEIAEIWKKLEKRSVIITAERRVGKTCILRKMMDNPPGGWLPLLCWVEEAGHPIDFIEEVYDAASRMEALGVKGKWLNRIRSAYKRIAGAEFKGWKLPSLRSDWKRLLDSLMEDLAENKGSRILIMIDEFPMMVSNIIDAPEAGPTLAMEFLNTLRVIRQKFQTSERIRFCLSGSIGLHLIIRDLKANHGYKGNPTNDMALKVLSGMCKEDVRLMCCKYLEEEGIARNDSSEFDQRMLQSTDGLPLYIQYVCERFQDDKKSNVSPADIDSELRALMDNREVEWFSNAAERIGHYYEKLNVAREARAILNFLSHEEDFVDEKEIISHMRSQMVVEHDEAIIPILELLQDDNYLIRDTTTGRRRYRFRYKIMQRWWKINKG